MSAVADKVGKNAEKLIRETLLVMMQAMPLHKIRVTELCRRAGLNRSSFYDHYQDVYEVVEQLEQDMMGELQALIKSKLDMSMEANEVTLAFMRFFADNREVLGPLLSNDTGAALFERFEVIVATYYADVMRRKGFDSSSDIGKAALEFSAASYWWLYRKIIQDSAMKDFNALAKMATEVTSNGLNSFTSWA